MLAEVRRDLRRRRLVPVLELPVLVAHRRDVVRGRAADDSVLDELLQSAHRDRDLGVGEHVLFIYMQVRQRELVGSG